jgi:hypothetical protein
MLDRLPGAHADDVRGRDVADARGVRIHVLGDGPHDDVAIGQDPDQAAVLDHGKRTGCPRHA